MNIDSFKNILSLDSIYSFKSTNLKNKDRLTNVTALEKLLDTPQVADLNVLRKIQDKLARDLAQSHEGLSSIKATVKTSWINSFANFFGWGPHKEIIAREQDLERIQPVVEKLAKALWEVEQDVRKLQKKEIGLKELKKKIGLPDVEHEQIGNYIRKNRASWEQKLDRMAKNHEPFSGFIVKKGEGLPLSLIVYRNPATNECSVAVLLKTKGRLAPLGKGAYKKVKLALDWETQKLQAQSIAYLGYVGNNEKIEDSLEKGKSLLEKEFRFQNLQNLLGKRGIALPEIHMLPYVQEKTNDDGISKKTVLKVSVLTPLYDGDLHDLINPVGKRKYADQISDLIKNNIKKLVIASFEDRNSDYFWKYAFRNIWLKSFLGNIEDGSYRITNLDADKQVDELIELTKQRINKEKQRLEPADVKAQKEVSQKRLLEALEELRTIVHGAVKDSHLDDRPPVTERERRIIVEDCLHGLAALEENGIFHNDLHVENIFFSRNENGHISGAFISDFGMAKYSNRAIDIHEDRRRLAFTLMELLKGAYLTGDEFKKEPLKGTINHILWRMGNNLISPKQALVEIHNLQ